jgi:hypothetical protein
MDCRIFAATPLLALLALCSSNARAASISLFASANATGIDGGTAQGGVPDGNFSQFDFSSVRRVAKVQDGNGLTEYRTILEFDVPAALKQPGVVIQSAIFTVVPAATGEPPVMLPDSRLQLYGYSGNGQADSSDFLNNVNLLWSFTNAAPPLSYNVTSHVDAIRATSARVGLLLTTNNWGGNYPLGSAATLIVEYTDPTGTAPTVSIVAPANNSQFATGTPVTFQGTASDVDGDAVGAITWSSSLNGALGSGSSITASSLAAGGHVITASATDSTGLTGQRTISITVGAPPAYCTARGTNSSYEWIRSISIGSWSYTSNNNLGYADFTANAPIPLAIGANNAAFQPGFMSGSYTEHWRVWIDLNRDNAFGANELLYSGSGTAMSSGTLTVPAGTATGATRMRVAMKYGSGAQPCGNFTYGEVEDYTVDIGAVPPAPPPVQYCWTTSNNNSYEWIASILIGSTGRYSGRGARYTDYSATQPAIPLSRGSTSVTLRPGFSGAAFYEHWRIWIDYNKDGVFGADEVAMAPVESSSVITGSITVPGAALGGSTRMRVSMRNGWAPPSCGSFSYGEVEDYTVSIAP